MIRSEANSTYLATCRGKDVRFLSLAQPAGNLEAFLNDLSGLQERGSLAPAELKALFQRHDMELVGPPLNSRP